MILGRDGIAGLILAGISLVLFVHSLGLPHLPIVPVGPGFYPRIVLGFLGLASLALVAQDAMAQRARAERAAGEPRNHRLVLALFAAFGAYVALMPLAGFRLATFAFVAAVQALLDPPRRAAQWAVLAAVALGTVTATYLVFETYLLVLLPRGTWTGW